MSSSFDTSAFAGTLGWAGGAVVVVLAATFGVAKIAGKHSVIDTTWGLLFVAIASTVFVRSSGHGDEVRRWLLFGLATLWGLRLAQHIGRRTIGKPEDPRYAELLDKARGNPDLYALRMIYLLQGLLAFIIAAPILVGAFERDSVGPLAWVGVAVWLVGVFFEAVGDSQLERFRRDPGNKGKVNDVGLWRYTRHPNYFGDACVWWGIFLVAADALPGVVTIYSPVIMTLLLTKGSGARILERHMSKRDGWDDYAARTSRFFPLPPKRTAIHS
ncbi:MAG: Steroid 5-alpha reductase family enzyme [Jatrophihabitans sp.]|nr:Steroid 5-alpha reductase family enzyme [Jatrophihabitans sp.]